MTQGTIILWWRAQMWHTRPTLQPHLGPGPALTGGRTNKNPSATFGSKPNLAGWLLNHWEQRLPEKKNPRNISSRFWMQWYHLQLLSTHNLQRTWFSWMSPACAKWLLYIHPTQFLHSHLIKGCSFMGTPIKAWGFDILLTPLARGKLLSVKWWDFSALLSRTQLTLSPREDCQSF